MCKHLLAFACVISAVLQRFQCIELMCNFTWHVCLWMKACIHFTSTYFFNVGWCISAVTWCSPVLLGIPLHVDVRSTWSRHMHAYLIFLSLFIHIYSYLLICLTRSFRLSVYCNIMQNRYRTKCQIRFYQNFFPSLLHHKVQRTESTMSSHHIRATETCLELFGGLRSSSRLSSEISELWILKRSGEIRSAALCFGGSRSSQSQQRRGILWEFRCHWFSSCTCNA